MSTHRYHPSPAVQEMEIDGEVTLFHAESQAALVLNGTASDVWRLLDGERSVEEIIRLLRAVYDVDGAIIDEGVESALAEFDRHGLIDVSAG